MRKTSAILVVSIIFSGFWLSAPAETAALFPKLSPGKHAVGFQVLFKKDPSRPYKPKRDYQGNLNTGDRSRPIQISVWYPAASAGTSSTLTFQDYLNLTTSEETGTDATQQQKQQAIAAFKNRWAAKASDNDIAAALATKTLAVRDAQPAKDRFPLILIATSTRMSSPVAISLLAEFLASHGYVVASSPSIGLASRQLSFDPLGTLTQMQDLQFLIANLNSFPAVDPNKLGIIGYSFGGLAGSLLAMYNTDVDAFVSLDSTAATSFGYSMLFQNPLYEPARLRVPVLHLTPQETNEASDNSFLRSIKYAPLTQVKIKGMTAPDFSSFSMITPLIPQPPSPEGQAPADKRSRYEAACSYIVQFLNAHTKKDAQALAYLKQPPEQNQMPAGLVIVDSRAGLKIPPSEEEFMKILREKGLAAAKAIHEETRKNDAEYNILDDLTLVSYGQELVDQKKTKDAIEVLNFNLEIYPNSTETFELLGTIYMNEGNKALAIENFEKVLEFDPQNQNAAENLKKLKS